ncbi:unnamed protein product [Calypogeia fissa]
MAMARVAHTVLSVGAFVRRDAVSWFVATRRVPHPAAGHLTCNLAFQRKRRGFSSEISSTVPTAPATRRQDECRLTPRANERPPGSVVTDNETDDTNFDTCEIVQGSDVTLGEGEDTFQAYLVKAIKNNSGVSILFLTDILGFNNADNRDFAYRLACFGYNVLVPDLFRGVPWSNERPKDEYEKWRDLHSPNRVGRDIDVATEYLVKHFGSTRKLCVIGFCFGGGRMIETLAKDSNKLFATGAFLYGTRFESSLATQIRAPLLLIAGDSDKLCSPETVHHLEQTVKGSKAKIYPGFGHAFAHHPSSPAEDEAAEDAFTEIRQWFHDRLISDSTD